MKKVISLFLLLFLFLSLGFSAYSYINRFNTENKKSAEYLNWLSSKINTTTVTDDVFKGLNIFTLRQGLKQPTGAVNESFLAVMDLEGNFVIEPLVGTGGQPELVNDTTFLHRSNGQPNFWNFKTNQTTLFNISRNSHHDVQYDVESDTFMVLEAFESPITNQTGQLENMVTDRISHYKSNGILIREWNLKDHTNFSWYYEILEKLNGSDIESFGDKLDPTHSNSIDWNVDTNIVYLNVRHFNQVYAVDMTDGTLRWIFGYRGNFTMYDINGNEKESLWFNSHDFNQVDEKEFVLFDNGRNNFTDTVDFTSEGSSIVHLKVDFDKREIHEVFRWESPRSYQSPIWGSTQLLENGNYLGSFGSFWHGPDFNNPYNTEFGGVAVEVDNNGKIVWEMRTPFNWGHYRIKRIIPTTKIDELDDLKLKIDETKNLTWESYSNFPKSFKIFVDGTEVESGKWDGASLSYDFSSDISGVYEIGVEAIDAAGYTVSDTVKVTISQETMTSTDESAIDGLYFGIVPIICLVVVNRRTY